MNHCEEYRDKTLLYLDHQLSGALLEDYRAHLQSCAECRADLAEERALSGLLKRSRPLYAAPDELRARLAAVQAKGVAGSKDVRKQPRTGVIQRLKKYLALYPRIHAVGAAAGVLGIGLALVPGVVREAQAMSYVEMAAATHRNYVDGDLRLELQSDSPEVVTAWFADKVPFHFQLPASQKVLDSKPTYRMTGASRIKFNGGAAALVAYEKQKEKISLVVASSEHAVVSGGVEVPSASLIFHYRNAVGVRVVTWTNHGLSYALVSSLGSSARESCLVCHQSMTGHSNFRLQP